MEINSTQRWLQRLVIMGTPLAIGIVELWHPRYISMQFYDKLLPMVDQWLTVHLLQLPLFGLLALALYLLVRDLHGLAALVSRAAMGIFVVFYTAFDSIVGIATGILIRNAQNLSPDQQATITKAVEELFLNPIVGDISVVSILGGGLGWVVGVFAAANALSRTLRERSLPYWRTPSTTDSTGNVIHLCLSPKTHWFTGYGIFLPSCCVA